MQSFTPQEIMERQIYDYGQIILRADDAIKEAKLNNMVAPAYLQIRGWAMDGLLDVLAKLRRIPGWATPRADQQSQHPADTGQHAVGS